MTPDRWMSILRHLMTFAGGVLTTTGAASPTDVETIGGAAVTVAGLLWSIFAKRPVR